jgi:hypothetical protein
MPVMRLRGVSKYEYGREGCKKCRQLHYDLLRVVVTVLPLQTKAPPNREVVGGAMQREGGGLTNQRGKSHDPYAHNSVSVCGTPAPNSGPIVTRKKCGVNRHTA